MKKNKIRPFIHGAKVRENDKNHGVFFKTSRLTLPFIKFKLVTGLLPNHSPFTPALISTTIRGAADAGDSKVKDITMSRLTLTDGGLRQVYLRILNKVHFLW